MASQLSAPSTEGASSSTAQVNGGVNGMATRQAEPSSIFTSQALHETAVEVQTLLKHIIVEVGKALRARTDLHLMLEETRAKKSASDARRAQLRLEGKAEDAEEDANLLTFDDEVFLRTYGRRSASDYIPNRKKIERACTQYNRKVHMLSEAIVQAKQRLVEEAPRALEREEQERQAAALAAAEEQARLEQLQKQQQEEKEARHAKLLAEQQAAAASAPAAETQTAAGADSKIDTVNVSDDEEDDKPLAGRTPAKNLDAGQHNASNNASVDLTADSPSATSAAPALAQPQQAAPASSGVAPPIDPAALLASLTGIPAANNTSSLPQSLGVDTSAPNSALPTGFDNFDFTSLGIGNFSGMDPSGAGGTDTNNPGIDFGTGMFSTAGDASIDFGVAGGTGGTEGMMDFNMDQFGDLDMSFLNNTMGEGTGEGGNGT